MDSEKLFLSGQSMGGYIAASCAPVIQPHGLILRCARAPGCGLAAHNADGIVQTGKDYTDMESLCYKMAFNYEMAKHPDPLTGPRATTARCCCAPMMTVWWTRAPAAVTHKVYTAPGWTPLQAAATTLAVPPWKRPQHSSK